MIPISEINPVASLPEDFGQLNLSWAKYLISIGALCEVTTTLLGSLFQPKIPLLNLVVSGVLSACLATVFDRTKLVELMSIGTLLAYTMNIRIFPFVVPFV